MSGVAPGAKPRSACTDRDPTARTTQQTVEAETAAFEAIASSLELTPSEALECLWWGTLQASGDEAKEFLVGVNPAAYISGKT